MKPANILLVACVCTFIASCSSGPVNVVIDKAGKDSTHTKVVIDEKIVFNLKGDSTVVVKLDPGEHFVQLNDSAKKSFTVTNKGGLLNISNQEYVVYEIKYSSKEQGNGFDFDQFRIKSAVLIDSFIVMPKAKRPLPDSVMVKLAAKLMNPEEEATTGNDYVNGLKKIGKGKFFINRFWDYNMTDSIPETIQVTTSNNGFSSNSTTRTSILRARNFLFAVLFSGQEEYSVKSIQEIREGKADKKDLKEKQSKQMKF